MSNGPERLRGLSPQELTFASWWVQHYLELRRLGFAFVIFLNVLCWGYALWTAVDAFGISLARENAIPQKMAMNQQRLAELETDRPQDLSIEEVGVIPLSDGRVDAYAVLQNPNAQWWAEVTYRFDLAGEQTPAKSMFILPGSTQYLTELGFAPTAKGVRNGSLTVDDIRWHRMDPAIAGADFASFSATRQRFVIEGLTYETDIIVGTKRVGQTTFEIVNDSAYGYWEVPVTIRLLRGNGVAGVSQVRLREFQPGEERRVQVVWPDLPVGASQTEVIPQVNLLDPAVYMKTEYFR